MRSNVDRRTKLGGKQCIAITLTTFFCVFSISLANQVIPGEGLVIMKEPCSKSEAQAKLDTVFTIDREIDADINAFSIMFSDTLDVDSMLQILLADNDVHFAQPNCSLTFAYIPGDVQFQFQTGFYDINGRNDTHAPEAWDITTGSLYTLGRDRIAIGVTDNGFFRDHEDMAGNYFVNEAELNGTDDLDDDGNGYDDDIYGWNVHDWTPDLPEAQHGTAIAGVIAARGENNEIGMAGVNWGAEIVPIVITSRNDAVQGWVYAKKTRETYESSDGIDGAYIVAVNLSSGALNSECEQDDAGNQELNWLGDTLGILTAIAAGNHSVLQLNDNIDNPGPPAGYRWPSRCPSDYSIVVMATDDNDQRWTESCWGWTGINGVSVDLAAPGVAQRTTQGENGYADLDGTSLSAPHVAGAVALLHSIPNPSFYEYYQNPHDVAGQKGLAAKDLKAMILNGADYWNNDPPDYWSLTDSRLNIANSIAIMGKFYHDNGHEFESEENLATFPSSTSNIALGRGTHHVYTSDDDVYYSWTFGCEGQRIYRLTTDRLSGSEPVIASVDNGSTDEIYIAWLAEPDGITILKHTVGGDCVPLTHYSEVWKLARIVDPAPSGTGVTVSSPVIAVESGTIPIALVAVSGGNDAGVHYWAAPGIEWLDMEGQEWVHGVVPASDGDNVTSVSAYTWENSDEIHVAWTTNEDEVHFVRGAWSGTTLAWFNETHEIVSSGLTGVSDLANVSYCYSTDLEAGFCVWEATQTSTGRRNIYRAWGLDDNGIDWETPAPLFSAHACWDRKSPQLHAYRDDGGSVSDDYCRVALAYENVRWDLSRGAVECTGLRINEGFPQNTGQWTWLTSVTRGLGKNPSITEWSNGGYGLFYVEDDGAAPYTFRTETVPLTYESTPTLADADVITTSVTMYPPINLDRNIVIEDGGELIISRTNWCDDPTTVTFANRTGITVNSGGSLEIVGESDSVITFQSLDPSGKWAGIVVNGGSLNMEYAELKDNDSVCIYTNSPKEVSISNCVLQGNKMVTNAPVLRLWYSPSTPQYVTNTIVTNVPNGVGFYPWGSNLEFDNVTIEDCDVVNSYIKSVTGNFRNCTFSGRASQYGVVFTGTGNTPNFQCCSIDNVSPLSGSYTSSIYAFSNSSPSFGYEGSTSGVSNEVKDSCSYLMRMTGSGVKPVVANQSSGVGGRNDWYQNSSSGKFFYWSSYPTPAVQYYAKGQYWDKGEDINKFYPASSSYYLITGSNGSPWGLCGGSISSIADRGPRSHEGLDDFESPYDSLFALAMSYEIERDFELSQPLFRTIASESDNYGLVWLAMTHAASNQRFLQSESEETWILPLIDSLVSVAPEELAYNYYVAAERLKGSYHLSLEDYEPAINTIANLLESGLTTMDSLYVSADLLNAYVVAGVVEYDGSLDNVNASDRVPQALRVTSSEQAWTVEQEILSSIAQLESGGESPVTAPMPTEFKLYQNYPNPFNPTTQIEFDLPEVSNLTLKVFNTLGQEVATVSDGKFNAGHYVMTWNGKSNAGIDVATGLYIYQLKAGSFLDTKKMILMR